MIDKSDNLLAVGNGFSFVKVTMVSISLAKKVHRKHGFGCLPICPGVSVGTSGGRYRWLLELLETICP